MKDKEIKNILNNIQEPYDPAHWEALRPELEARKKRRSLVWPWYMLASIMLLALSFLLWQTSQVDLQKDSIQSNIAEGFNENRTFSTNRTENLENANSDLRAEKALEPSEAVDIDATTVEEIEVLTKINALSDKEMPFVFEEDAPGDLQSLKGIPPVSTKKLQPLLDEAPYIKRETQTVHQGKSSLAVFTGIGLTAGGWLNPELNRLWYSGAAASFEIKLKAFVVGFSPALLRTDNNFKDEWLPVDIQNQGAQFAESNAGAFSPMTILQKQRVAFAPGHQLVLPLHISWQKQRGSLYYAIGPNGGISTGWGDVKQTTQGFLGIRAALGLQLGKRAHLSLSYAHNKLFSDRWTEFNRAALTFNHHIR